MLEDQQGYKKTFQKEILLWIGSVLDIQQLPAVVLVNLNVTY
ncbi:uncharacterized protein YjaZ [Planomicrobium stackebrandtii]|uniref:Uncharacterized protein YjaZ n=1 Tax=Planomicrobium stackebrandtii TaxID=253160 RepID=A0ABU0GRF1_9BACL|nr:uncharacterized protein YjaZ [Planomicrobium stackebrandtii]